MAQALPGSRSGRTARRAPPLPAAYLRGRQGCRGDQPGPADQNRRWQHPVVSTFSRSRHRNFKNHRSPLATNLLGPAAPAEISPLRGNQTATSSPPIRSLWRRFATSSACISIHSAGGHSCCAMAATAQFTRASRN